MASKGKKPTTKKDAGESNVTRITATDTKKKAVVTKAEPTATKIKKSEGKRVGNPIKATGGYFVGAWQELRQVRWPNRRATWSMTLALLVFTAFFVVLVLLLDALFKYLFQLILG